MLRNTCPCIPGASAWTAMPPLHACRLYYLQPLGLCASSSTWLEAIEELGYKMLQKTHVHAFQERVLGPAIPPPPCMSSTLATGPGRSAGLEALSHRQLNNAGCPTGWSNPSLSLTVLFLLLLGRMALSACADAARGRLRRGGG